MEQLYADFTTKFLPKIQEGLVISKDYFTDLFGRYVKYLIVTDTLNVIFGIVTLVVVVFLVCNRRFRELLKKGFDDYDMWPIVACCGIGLATVIGIILFFTGLTSLVKDIYIPEVRIYQKLIPNKIIK